MASGGRCRSHHKRHRYHSACLLYFGNCTIFVIHIGKSENYARMLKPRLCGSPGDLAPTKHTPGRRKDRRSRIYHQIGYRIQSISSAYLQLEIPMVFGVSLRTEHICRTHQQISLKSCLNILEYRLGKYQDMHWSVSASVLPYVRLHLQAWKAESAKKPPHANLDCAALRAI